MENIKTPLTWVLGIVCVGYLFIANCECGEESTCPLNNGFNISNAGLNNGFNISNAGLNGDVLKIDAPETVEEVEVPVELFSEDFIEYLKEQGFTDSEIEILQLTGPPNEAEIADLLEAEIEEE